MAYRRTVSLTVKQALTDAQLAALFAVPGAALLLTPEVVLWIADVNPTPQTVIGDLTPPTFTGYAADSIGTMTGPVNQPSGARSLIAQVDFVVTADVSPVETIYGYSIVDTGGTILYYSERFTEPWIAQFAGDFLSLDIVITQPAYLPAA